VCVYEKKLFNVEGPGFGATADFSSGVVLEFTLKEEGGPGEEENAFVSGSWAVTAP
jgi:hypothetical protein